MTVTRFAPSPTGRLHLGHAYSALFAKARGERFLLRIEDIDRARCRAEFERGIYEDLAWLGIEWETPARRQSEHFDEYRAALAKLDAMGLLYRCVCTRGEIAMAAPHGDAAVYPGTCRGRDVDPSLPHALRLDVAKAMAEPLEWRDRARGVIAADPLSLGDVVLARKDTPASYHLCVTIDDARQGVTLVTRGEDLFASTHVHRLLQQLLGLDVPEYEHHALVRDAAGERLAKRAGSPSIASLREAGLTRDDVIARIGSCVPSHRSPG